MSYKILQGIHIHKYIQYIYCLKKLFQIWKKIYFMEFFLTQCFYEEMHDLTCHGKNVLEIGPNLPAAWYKCLKGASTSVG